VYRSVGHPKPKRTALEDGDGNLRKTAMGLPLMHIGGGVVVEAVAEQRRS
jgi:hypothetical protein